MSALPLPPEARAGERRLRVIHITRYRHAVPVELAHHIAYLRPRESATQRVLDWALQVDPAPQHAADPPSRPAATPGDRPSAGGDATPGVRFSLDVWGNWRAHFHHARVHEGLQVDARFEVLLRPGPALQPAISPRWEVVAAQLRRAGGGVDWAPAAEFALPSHYAPRDPALERFAREAFAPGQPLLGAALALMHRVHQQMAYRPSTTTVSTRALEALRQQRGVCQDFAHVMIGAMRSLGLAARYVSGYLLTHPPPGQPRLIGADATHAWVEVWCPLHGWVALDPTNAVPVGLDHVTLAWGRDYADVAPLRGVIRGGSQSAPQVEVTVEPAG